MYRCSGFDPRTRYLMQKTTSSRYESNLLTKSSVSGLACQHGSSIDRCYDQLSHVSNNLAQHDSVQVQAIVYQARTSLGHPPALGWARHTAVPPRPRVGTLLSHPPTLEQPCHPAILPALAQARCSAILSALGRARLISHPPRPRTGLSPSHPPGPRSAASPSHPPRPIAGTTSASPPCPRAGMFHIQTSPP
ncbi:hypothetical protein N665_0194s0015 [Sinapis alba]|nr:hypothetical protein N665_0194s0015 [Sinapis alba]